VERYAAFLRGINLGGHHRVKSGELRSLFIALGLDDVATFRASGNVIFSAAGAAEKLTRRIEAELRDSLGFEVATYLRSRRQLLAIAGAEPFPAAALKASKGRLQIAFLRKLPPQQVRGEVLALATEDDRLAFGKRELFWLPRGGTQQSALNVRTIDRLVGPMTMRTMGTVAEIAARHFAP
jgi:uncharacterized protein (DUF1697 family)